MQRPHVRLGTQSVGRSVELTDLIEHLITLIQNKCLDSPQPKVFVANQGVKPSGGADNDMGMSILVLQILDIFLHRRTAIENSRLNLREILAEAGIFVLDLVRQLSSVAHDQHRRLVDRSNDLLQSGEYEHSSLSEARFGLAENVGAQYGLRNAHLLNCRRKSMAMSDFDEPLTL